MEVEAHPSAVVEPALVQHEEEVKPSIEQLPLQHTTGEEASSAEIAVAHHAPAERAAVDVGTAEVDDEEEETSIVPARRAAAIFLSEDEDEDEEEHEEVSRRALCRLQDIADEPFEYRTNRSIRHHLSSNPRPPPSSASPPPATASQPRTTSSPLAAQAPSPLLDSSWEDVTINPTTQCRLAVAAQLTTAQLAAPFGAPKRASGSCSTSLMTSSMFTRGRR